MLSVSKHLDSVVRQGGMKFLPGLLDFNSVKTFILPDALKPNADLLYSLMNKNLYDGIRGVIGTLFWNPEDEKLIWINHTDNNRRSMRWAAVLYLTNALPPLPTIADQKIMNVILNWISELEKHYIDQGELNPMILVTFDNNFITDVSDMVIDPQSISVSELIGNDVTLPLSTAYIFS